MLHIKTLNTEFVKHIHASSQKNTENEEKNTQMIISQMLLLISSIQKAINM